MTTRSETAFGDWTESEHCNQGQIWETRVGGSSIISVLIILEEQPHTPFSLARNHIMLSIGHYMIRRVRHLSGYGETTWRETSTYFSLILKKIFKGYRGGSIISNSIFG